MAHTYRNYAILSQMNTQYLMMASKLILYIKYFHEQEAKNITIHKYTKIKLKEIYMFSKQ